MLTRPSFSLLPARLRRSSRTVLIIDRGWFCWSGRAPGPGLRASGEYPAFDLHCDESLPQSAFHFIVSLARSPSSPSCPPPLNDDGSTGTPLVPSTAIPVLRSSHDHLPSLHALVPPLCRTLTRRVWTQRKHGESRWRWVCHAAAAAFAPGMSTSSCLRSACHPQRYVELDGEASKRQGLRAGNRE